MGFNACAPGFKTEGWNEGTEINSSSASSVCESQLEIQYAATYFPLLSQNCSLCHAQAQGSQNLSVSFAAFQARGVQLIDYQATHPHGGNNVNLSESVQEMKPAWNQAVASYEICKLNENKISSMGILMNSIPFSQYNRSLADAGYWMNLEWDLNQDLDSRSSQKALALFSIDVRLAVIGQNIVGLEFRNPTLKTSSTSYHFSGLVLQIDGQDQKAFTIYKNVSVDMPAHTVINLASQSAYGLIVLDKVSAKTAISFRWENVE